MINLVHSKHTELMVLVPYPTTYILTYAHTVARDLPVFKEAWMLPVKSDLSHFHRDTKKFQRSLKSPIS